MQVYQPFAQPANQDRKHFPLGTSTAKPAFGYYAGVAELESEQVIRDAIEGLPSEQLEETLAKLFQGSYKLARDYMKWRLRMNL